VQTTTPYLDNLNPEQRRAVEHGAAGGLAASPLLVIAGAGSGKTNTLAHRVAHLIVQGADPRRILLMTFSRRAAGEMTKRVERIARKVMGDNAGVMTDALTWAGTYHGIGARLLREYAEQIGLDPAFTIHDREDSADLMNLVRHEKGDRKPLPDQRHLPFYLFALRQCRDANRASHRLVLSMVLRVGRGAQGTRERCGG
jgi:DNA helicase-2/ATP-dependent DNA helicase PcrA